MSDIKLPDRMVLVDRGLLTIVINALRRDAEEGKQVRGEMADLLSEAPAAPQPAHQGDALSYVHPVPDHCDRVVWRNRYLHLAAQAQEAAPAAQGEPSDTERLDWLATHAKRWWHSGDGYYLQELRFRWGDSLIRRTLREAVDDARAAQQKGASNG